ncbi:MAG TPA: hypothetical protein VFR85_11410 [Anaeromyxobacteraceae bacterium]|nr:hypothetical protein [Anaeromyxobacteraceae bacterium]
MSPAAALLLASSLALPDGADGWRLAAKVGLLEPDSSLGPAFRPALEGAWSPASFGGWLVLAVELSFASPSTGAPASLIGLPTAGWSASADDLALELAFAWRGEGALGPVTPYGWIGLSLHLARVEVTWLGSPWSSTQARPGASLRAGAEWSLGGGGPFLEAGWSVASAHAGPAGMLELGGFLLSAGWRLAL